ncbi:MAG: hypothetical protein CM1200mP10_17580 [Candidatus Neomarinimicrobiota bacterium]|nr:MAG: hypothetical protein CM1200mP10_17580 [Candidatus Neomarinimicrobiota bacterium]
MIFPWFADKNWIVRKGELVLPDSTRYGALWSFYLPKNAELWENSIEYLHDSGYWFGKFYGEYPYNHITAVGWRYVCWRWDGINPKNYSKLYCRFKRFIRICNYA